jgi:hypothetical protein
VVAAAAQWPGHGSLGTTIGAASRRQRWRKHDRCLEWAGVVGLLGRIVWGSRATGDSLEVFSTGLSMTRMPVVWSFGRTSSSLRMTVEALAAVVR